MLKSKMKFYKIIFIYIIGSFLYAQNNDIKFERLGTKNGLTQNNITSITQDELGYIWIATENGLNRYDGYNFRAYLYDPDNDNSPHGNWINYLLSDSHGKLWMFLGAGGIDCFDTKTEKFERYTSDEKDSSGLPEKFLNFPYLDKWDNLWLGTFNSGLLKFDRNNRNFIKIANNPADEFSISSNRTLCAFADSLNGNKYLWIGAGNFGFNQLNIETGEIIRIQWRDIKPGKKLYDFVKSKISNNKNIASIIKTGDAKKISKSFSLNKKTKILIVSEGEAIPVSNIDYGKIFKNNKMIWQSDQNKSAFAGGENRNRIQFDILELDKGSYDLYFETDSLHSYDKWYNNAPDYPEYWGIQIFEIDDKEIAEINYDIKKWKTLLL